MPHLRLWRQSTNSQNEENIGTPCRLMLFQRVKQNYAHTFHKLYNLEVIGLRYFNVFGPRQNPNGPYALQFRYLLMLCLITPP